jgi:hypothetical protein
MRHLMVVLVSVSCLAPPAAAQSLNVGDKLELTVTKVERVTEWQPPGGSRWEPAAPGTEFAKLHFTPRWLAGASGDPCDTRAESLGNPPVSRHGEYVLIDARDRQVAGIQFEYEWEPGSTGCKEFTILFGVSPKGVPLTKVRIRGSDADISQVPGAKGEPAH